MQRNMAFLGLIASVGLLLAVFAFALNNSELFIDDLSSDSTESTPLSLDESAPIDAKISGDVVGSQETQVRESAKIQKAELDALQKEQWLQVADPTLDEASLIEESLINDDALNFAPEIILSGKVKDSATIESVDVENNEIAIKAEEPQASSKQLLEELRNMTFTEIQFQFGLLALSDKALQKVTEVANILKENTNIHAKINNYTDSYGDDNFNLELSRQRANMVYQAFLDRGVNEQQLSFEGLGESNPLTSNATLAGRKKNRRTEILFFEAN